MRPTRLRLVAAALAVAVVAAIAVLWPAGGADRLVIYSAMGPSGAMIPAFEAETGLHVTYINMGGGPLQARIYAEGARPRWTVAWFVGDAAMAALDRADLLARHAPDGTDPLDAEWPDPDWTSEARALLPPDGAYLPTGLILAGVFVTRHTAPAPSTSWPALPKVAGGVGLVSPVASGTAYPVLSATMEAAGGIEAGHALLRALRSQGLGVFAANPLLVAQLRSGDVMLGVLPSEAAYALAERDPGFRVTVPRPAGLVPAVIGVSARAPPTARAAAARFIRFLLTAEGQRLVRQSTAEGFAWPPVAGAPVPPGLPRLADLALVHPDAEAWGARQGEEIGWFRREIAP